MPDEQAETFVVEPETQLDGSPAPERAWLRPPSSGGKLAAPTLLARAEGAALLICFVLLPWFGFPQPVLTPRTLGLNIKSYTGWEAALGFYVGPTERFDIFVHLWLVPLVAVALLVLAWLFSRRLFSTRLMLGMMIALSALALLVELGFWEQGRALTMVSGGGPPLAGVGVLWGAWVTVAVNVLALAWAVYLLRQVRGSV
jgi:hypothetical protein